MAATTITRTTWTDGDSGTVIDNAEKNSAIYDPIDSLIANAITFGDVVSAEGFGNNDFIAGGTGHQGLRVRNTAAGVGNGAFISVGNDSAATLGFIEAWSSSFTETNIRKQNGVSFEVSGAGGLYLATTNASGTINLFAKGTTKNAQFDGDVVKLASGVAGTYSLSGVLADSVNTTQAGTPGNVDETDLHTYTLPAGTLAANNQMVRYIVCGAVAANGNTKRLKLKFGGTTVYDSGAVALEDTNGGQWSATALVVRTGAATQKALAWATGFPNLAPSTAGPDFTSPTETLSGTVDIKCTGQNGTSSANDITAEFSFVEFLA